MAQHNRGGIPVTLVTGKRVIEGGRGEAVPLHRLGRTGSAPPPRLGMPRPLAAGPLQTAGHFIPMHRVLGAVRGVRLEIHFSGGLGNCGPAGPWHNPEQVEALRARRILDAFPMCWCFLWAQ